MPVLLTDMVGSKDIVENNDFGIIVEGNVSSILENIVYLYNNKYILKQLNENIVNTNFSYLLKDHYYVINKIYVDERNRL